MPSAAEFSLFNHITSPKDASLLQTQNEATALIKFLVEVVAKDACRAKRSPITSYRLVEIVRDLRDEIDTLINAVAADDDPLDENIWGKFDKYSGAITPLEEYLFKLALTTDAERDLFLASDVDVAGLITAIGTWETNRKDLQTTLPSELSSKTKLTSVLTGLSTDLAEEGSQDDMDLLFSLCKEIGDHILTDNNVARRRTTAPIATLKQRLTISSTSGCIFERARCAMLVLGAMNLATHATNSNLATQVRRKVEVWVQAEVVMIHVRDANADATKLNNAWNKLKEYLEALEVSLPPEFLTLRTKASTVRRPYYSRTIFLVSQCRKLATHFCEAGNKTAANLPYLKNAIDKSQEAIVAACTNADAIKIYNNFTGAGDAGEPTVVTAFDAAITEIKAAFNHYGLIKEEGQVDGGLTAALGVDKALMDKLNPKYTNYAAKASPTPTNPITIKVTHGGGEKSYIVEKDTRPLRNIRCQVAVQEPVPANRTAILAKKFKEGTNDFDIDGKLTTNISLKLE